MNLFEQLKRAISQLHEEDLYLNLPHKETLSVAPAQKTQLPPPPVPVEREDPRPFTPLRQKRSTSLFTPSAPLKPNPPGIAHEEVKPSEEKPSFDPFLDIKKLLLKIAPSIKLYDTLPDDRVARKIARAYENKTQFASCIILYENRQGQGLMLLKNLEKAIESRSFSTMMYCLDEIAATGLLEEILNDPQVKLILTCYDWIVHYPKLLNMFHEKTGSLIKKLGTKDVIILSPIEFYLKDPALKRSLWNQLMSYIAS
jgi:hypothetical protein